jgi:peptide/nickel transport system substrate-binding protein
VKNRILFIALAVVLSLSVGLVGCSSTTPPEIGGNNTLIMALSTLQEETFLPWNGGLARAFYMDSMYETLTLLDPTTGHPLPCIASSWNHTPDALTWTFNITPNIPFHDALNHTYGYVTADDVKYTIDGIMAPDSIVGPASAMRAEINNVTVVGNLTVVIYLKTADPLLDTSYMCQGNPVWIVSKSYIQSVGNATANAKPVGTGPFVLKSHSPGSSIILQTYESTTGVNHWRVTSPAFKYIEFLNVPDVATRVAGLKSGDYDLAPVGFDDIAGLLTSGCHMLTIPGSWSPYMVLGGTCPSRPARWNPSNPWANITVREALNMAINKTEIVHTIFHDLATVTGAQSYVPGWLNITDWFAYNVTGAADLLTAAGYPSGFSMTIKEYSTTPGAELAIVAQAVANYWRAINITVTEESVSYANYLRGQWTGDNATTYVWPHRGMAMTDPVQACKSAFTNTSLFDVYSDNDTEALLATILASSDPAFREAQANAFAELLKSKVAFVPIAFCPEPYGATSKIGTWPSLSVTIANIYQITHG